MIDYKKQVLITDIKSKYAMLNISCFTKRKRVSNTIIGVTDSLVNLKSALIIIQ